MAHKDIQIQFEIEGRRYEAVGFLREDEESVSGYEILRRTAEVNGGVIGEDETVFLQERLSQFPTYLSPYELVTNRRHAKYPYNVACFGGDERDGWYQFWVPLPNSFWCGKHVLVLRRLQ